MDPDYLQLAHPPCNDWISTMPNTITLYNTIGIYILAQSGAEKHPVLQLLIYPAEELIIHPSNKINEIMLTHFF